MYISLAVDNVMIITESIPVKLLYAYKNYSPIVQASCRSLAIAGQHISHNIIAWNQLYSSTRHKQLNSNDSWNVHSSARTDWLPWKWTLFIRAARSPVFYGSSRISGRFSCLPFKTNKGDIFSHILTSLNFVAWFISVTISAM